MDAMCVIPVIIPVLPNLNTLFSLFRPCRVSIQCALSTNPSRRGQARPPGVIRTTPRSHRWGREGRLAPEVRPRFSGPARSTWATLRDYARSSRSLWTRRSPMWRWEFLLLEDNINIWSDLFSCIIPLPQFSCISTGNIWACRTSVRPTSDIMHTSGGTLQTVNLKKCYSVTHKDIAPPSLPPSVSPYLSSSHPIILLASCFSVRPFHPWYSFQNHIYDLLVSATLFFLSSRNFSLNLFPP